VRVLLVEDYKPMVRALRKGLADEPFSLDVAGDGTEADTRARSETYDVIVLDLLLWVDSLALLRGWRRDNIKTHVLALTDGSARDRVRVLDSGADDCLSKPFALLELVARLRALLRRQHRANDPVIRIHDLEIDTRSHTVKRAGQIIDLTAREYALLEFLAVRRGSVVTRPTIWQYLYGERDAATSNVVDVYIRYLRNKIDRGSALPLLLTRWGEGYLLRE
jgi:DNA-binding response OmpR family regulator